MADDAAPGDESAWARTIEEMNDLAERLAADGWDVVATPAGHVAPESPSSGDSDRFGFVFVVPGDEEDAFRDAFETGEFGEYQVFRRRVGNHLYLVVQFTDPDAEIAILLAGGVDMTEAQGMIDAARDRGEMYTHVQLLDWTHLGSFRHEDFETFFEATER